MGISLHSVNTKTFILVQNPFKLVQKSFKDRSNVFTDRSKVFKSCQKEISLSHILAAWGGIFAVGNVLETSVRYSPWTAGGGEN